MCRPAGRALVGGRSAATAGGRPDSTSAGVERHGASPLCRRTPHTDNKEVHVHGRLSGSASWRLLGVVFV